MFWKFGFHSGSSIDALLDRDDVALEAILNEDDLLQECKAQNTRLIDYFQRPDVLHRLLGYVTGEFEGENEGKFKYPYVATEVLCSEIWSIVETCVNNADQLLAPFWEYVLSRSPEEMRLQSVMASQFTKINTVFIGKKPAEMFMFIKSQENVVGRILKLIECPAFVDLLFRIIQLDEYSAAAGVLEWLSDEGLIARLVNLLSPDQDPAMHTVVSELIKGIISMAAPSPGAGLSDGLHNGPASNIFARQLAQRHNLEKLVSYMIDEYTPTNATGDSHMSSSTDLTSPFPNDEAVISSGVHAISIIIELIRKNNSDYFEPYLFHTLRNRLIQVQQHLDVHTVDGREYLEQAMRDMVDRMGVVNLSSLIDIMCDKLQKFQGLLKQPRTLLDPIPTTLGRLVPLTFERFRICELYAELLHCSNMSLLNRSSEFDHLYDAEGRLQGGLLALEELARVIAIGSGQEDQDPMDADDELEPAQELPVSSASINSASLESDEEDMSDDPSSSDEDVMEEIAMHESNSQSPPISPVDEAHLQFDQQPSLVVPSSPNPTSIPVPTELATRATTNNASTSPGARPRSSSSRRSLKQMDSSQISSPTAGDRLKRAFAQTGVLPTLIKLFCEFPWNNFLHSVVYDVIHQILTGRVDAGYNRQLVIALFRDAHLTSRILEMQKRNDTECAKPKGIRLGFMGHLTLISEDVISAMEHYPPDLRLELALYAPQPEWDDYVSGRYSETKSRDMILLGGGKPTVIPVARESARWKVDEEDTFSGSGNTSQGQNQGNTASTSNNSGGVGASPGGSTSSNGYGESTIRGEFRRTNRLTRDASADFGVAPVSNEEVESGEGASAPVSQRFASYLEQELSSTGGSASDGSDDEDEDGGWLAQHRFDLRPPPVSSRFREAVRRPLSPGGFGEPFEPQISSSSHPGFDDTFGDDDDTFGPFSDSAAIRNDSDPYSYSSADDPDVEDVAFGDFGDFGEFQSSSGSGFSPSSNDSGEHDPDPGFNEGGGGGRRRSGSGSNSSAGSGQLTPTGGSWTFAAASDALSLSSGSDDADLEEIGLSRSGGFENISVSTSTRPSGIGRSPS